MRRASLVSAFVALLVGSGLAIGQTTAPAAKTQTSTPSHNPAKATRLQTMAEGTRLMHEAMTPER